ncbi:M20/M25/M40 family metallo-hydrolase [bacterium]|nr:M20/M25/M40 family metallo-hydrolase [bacterium]
MIAALVAQRSISSADPKLDTSNRGVCEQLAGWLQPLGFDCKMLPVPVAGAPDKVNLLARLGPRNGQSAGLVLAGHADTVPFDADGWHSDPFKVQSKDDALFGLGVCDMKGFLALAAEVAAEYRTTKLTAPLTLLATANEETGMEGARALAESGALRGGCAVIGEPTNLQPVHAHKGILMEAITLHGSAGHSSNPALGANTIYALPLGLKAMRALKARI